MDGSRREKRRARCLGLLAACLLVLGGCGETAGTGPAVAGPAAQGPTHDVAFVANGVGGTITLIDMGNLKVLGHLDVVPDGRTVGLRRDGFQSLIGQPFMERGGKNYAQDQEASPDGRVLYVSRGHLGDVAAFDLATRQLMWRVPVGGARSDHMVLSEDGSRLYVSALTANKVSVVDTASGKIVGSFPTGNWPHDSRISKDGKRIFTASIGTIPMPHSWRDNRSAWLAWLLGESYVLTEARTDTLKVVETYPFPAGLRPWKLSATEDRLYGQLSDYHGVIEYSLAQKAITRWLDLPVAPGVTAADWDFEAPHHGLDMTRDGKLLCIAGRASDYIALVSTESMQPLAYVPAGDAPGWAAISPDQKYCVVPNTRGDDVSIVSLAEQKEVARLRAGRGPKHVRMGTVSEATLAAFAASQPAAEKETPRPAVSAP